MGFEKFVFRLHTASDKEQQKTCATCGQPIGKNNVKEIWYQGKLVGHRHSWCKVPLRYTRGY